MIIKETATWKKGNLDAISQFPNGSIFVSVSNRNPNFHNIGVGFGDWTHINSMSLLGPNRLYVKGDQRFHPDNIIWSGRQTNIIAIVDKKSGKIVWKLGPDHNVVWEYVSPFFSKERNSNLIYRAYRVPYDWVPQIKKPEEMPVLKRDVGEFSLSRLPPKAANRVIDMADAQPFEADSQSCVVTEDKGRNGR